ncbi:hypothetical protein RT97_05240 [Variovorax paradoxus]|uniref:Uncharacterized protein n=1 Tax=Variovorax paradoxus TaxID=34073 RepID=A0A0D0LAM1_VARPD|nr:hypothetical protein RT97_05240 [Variovorax paradoxus]
MRARIAEDTHHAHQCRFIICTHVKWLYAQSQRADRDHLRISRRQAAHWPDTLIRQHVHRDRAAAKLKVNVIDRVGICASASETNSACGLRAFEAMPPASTMQRHL